MYKTTLSLAISGMWILHSLANIAGYLWNRGYCMDITWVVIFCLFVFCCCCIVCCF